MHREVGRAKDISTPRYSTIHINIIFDSFNTQFSLKQSLYISAIHNHRSMIKGVPPLTIHLTN